MHEVSIAMSILDIVKGVAEEEKASEIEELILDVGTLSGVVYDSLQFAMEIVKKGTLIEHSSIIINSIQATAQCLDCQQTFPVEQLYQMCPKCEDYNIQIINGKELKVKSISFQE